MNTEHRNEMSFDLLDVKTFENSQSFYLSICKFTNLYGRKQEKIFYPVAKNLRLYFSNGVRKTALLSTHFTLMECKKCYCLEIYFKSRRREEKKKSHTSTSIAFYSKYLLEQTVIMFYILYVAESRSLDVTSKSFTPIIVMFFFVRTKHSYFHNTKRASMLYEMGFFLRSCFVSSTNANRI